MFCSVPTFTRHHFPWNSSLPWYHSADSDNIDPASDCTFPAHAAAPVSPAGSRSKRGRETNLPAAGPVVAGDVLPFLQFWRGFDPGGSTRAHRRLINGTSRLPHLLLGLRARSGGDVNRHPREEVRPCCPALTLSLPAEDFTSADSPSCTTPPVFCFRWTLLDISDVRFVEFCPSDG